MPLLAHVLLYVAAKPEKGWAENWAPDLLFITISNFGLAALSVFVRMATGDISSGICSLNFELAMVDLEK
jgi:hypothetical protein